MDIPTVPTDNLYKFMAIVGLLMIAGGIIFDQYFELELAKLDKTYSVARSENDRKFNQAVNAYAGIDNQLLTLIGAYKDKLKEAEVTPAKAAKDALLKAAANLQRQMNELNSRQEALREKQMEDLVAEDAKLGEKEVVVVFYKGRAQAVLVLAACFVVGGVALTITGFGLWYFRLQRPMDKQIAAARRKPS